jgi:hypothetical protein
MEKHTPYFKVLETLQKAKGCALCVLEKEAFHSYFDAFLYENVNNPVAREALKVARGWCPQHAHFLVGFHDTLALSILYKEQTLLAASFLEKYSSRGDLFVEWGRHEPCPACRQAVQIRRHYIGILVKGLEESEMRKAFLDRFHVCFHHLLMVMDDIHDEGFKRELAGKMRSRLTGLADRLEQYCQDCQKNGAGEEFDSPHRYAWKEAVEIAVGLKDIFEPLL